MSTSNRNWTDVEVDAMIDFIKAKRPGFCEELARIDRVQPEPIDDPNDPGLVLYRLINDAHPEAKLGGQAGLMGRVHLRLRSRLEARKEQKGT